MSPYGSRAIYGSAVFHDRLFVIGGINPNPESQDFRVLYNDVWSSSDGSNWTKLTENAPFSPRSSLKVAASIINSG